MCFIFIVSWLNADTQASSILLTDNAKPNKHSEKSSEINKPLSLMFPYEHQN